MHQRLDHGVPEEQCVGAVVREPGCRAPQRCGLQSPVVKTGRQLARCACGQLRKRLERSGITPRSGGHVQLGQVRKRDQGIHQPGRHPGPRVEAVGEVFGLAAHDDRRDRQVVTPRGARA